MHDSRKYLGVEIGLGLCAVAGLLAWTRGVANREAMAKLLKRRVLPFALGVGFAGAVVVRARAQPDCIERSRNFFGQLAVQQAESIEQRGPDGHSIQRTQRLRHGSTLHGEQITGDDVEPGMGHTYFGNGSGVAKALRNHPARASRALRVGVIGLGTGTLASYARKNDHYTFHEIDPAIIRIAGPRSTEGPLPTERGHVPPRSG